MPCKGKGRKGGGGKKINWPDIPIIWPVRWVTKEELKKMYPCRPTNEG